MGIIKRRFCLWCINTFFRGFHYGKIKRWLLRCAGIKCGEGTNILGPIYISDDATVSIGSCCWIGAKLTIYGGGEVNIGSNIFISPEAAFITSSHEVSENELCRAGRPISFKISVGDGCWIGTRATVMGNTNIGAGAVIGACALVNKSLDGNAVYGGVPASDLGLRHSRLTQAGTRAGA